MLIWEEVGVEEMPNSYDSNSNQTGGWNISDESRGESEVMLTGSMGEG